MVTSTCASVSWCDGRLQCHKNHLSPSLVLNHTIQFLTKNQYSTHTADAEGHLDQRALTPGVVTPRLVESLTRSRSCSRGVLVCHSVAAINTMTKATSERERFHWFTLLGHSPSPREVRMKSQAEMKQKWRENVAYGLSLWLRPSWIP